MKTLLVVASLSIVLLAPLPGDAADSVYERNRAYFAASYDALLAKQDGPAVDWDAPDASRFLDRAAARAGDMDLAALSEGAGDGGDGDGPFPLAADFALMEMHAEYTWVHQRPNRGTECNQEDPDGPGGHYDAATRAVPGVTHPDHGMDYVGAATSNWTNNRATGLAFVYPPGTFMVEPGTVEPLATLPYQGRVGYAGQSDFWCLNERIVLFGICIYLDLNFPKVLGIADTDLELVPSVPADERPRCP